MRIKLLIATTDVDYAGHLSERISERYADAISVSVCSSQERMGEMLAAQRYDVALLEAPLTEVADPRCIHLPMLLWTEDGSDPVDPGNPGEPGTLKRISKYQRVSSIVASVIENFAKSSTGGPGADSGKARITAVWSPAGGVGKTTVAFAYAQKKVTEGKKVLYLNLELFSSVPVYFREMGKSISSVFEMLENNEGNIRMLIQGIKQQDSGGGLTYFCRPDNFDDMNILSTGNIAALVDACAGVADELVIDMSCACDDRARHVLRLADRVFLVTDNTITAQVKLTQFTSQHNVFDQIKDKTTLVANKGASAGKPLTNTFIQLPAIQTSDATAVYTTLSGSTFE